MTMAAVEVAVPMCADFIHVGHLNLLETAAAHGKVTVFLMTDAAMKAYKRPPAFSYADRARIVGELKHVHSVLPCDGPATYGNICRAHNPAVFVHGDDWKLGPQAEARVEVFSEQQKNGGTVVEPPYTPGISSTVLHKHHALPLRQRVLLRLAMNDLKQTIPTIAEKLGIAEQVLTNALSGTPTSGHIDGAAIMARVADAFPIPKKHLDCDLDTSVSGIWVQSREQSFSSARIISRNAVPYYKYMDLAMSALAPFKPEHIEQLVAVSDSTPHNSNVVMNKGHLLSQFTYFIGPVNFYYTVGGVRYCEPMNTGDSCFITPYVPHSFTSRDSECPSNARIIAVTFSGSAKDALGDISALDCTEFLKCCGDRRDGSATAQRQLRYAELNPGQTMPDDVAPLRADEEVVIERKGSSKYITSLAHSVHFPEARAFVIELGEYSGSSQFYQFWCNVGSSPITVCVDGSTTTLDQYASVIVKPFTAYDVTADTNATLYCVKLPGAITKSVLDECSLFAPHGRKSMLTSVTQWW